MSTAPERHKKVDSEVRNVAVSFANKLDSGELLTGTPTATEVSTTDLTISDVAVNTAALTISGVSVAVGEAVQFKVSGGTAGVKYKVRVTCATDSSPAQTLIVDVVFRVSD